MAIHVSWDGNVNVNSEVKEARGVYVPQGRATGDLRVSRQMAQVDIDRI